MESRKQSELPQQLGKKIIQALKAQNASSQPKSPIATSSNPVVEDNSFVSKSVSPIGLEVIDHMDFGSQELSLEEPKTINNKQQSYSDPFLINDSPTLNSNTQVQEYGSFITPEETGFSDFEVPESEPVQNNYLLEEPTHNLSEGFYEEYDFDNENYQAFQSQTPAEFEGMQSYENYSSEQQVFHEEKPKSYHEEEVLTSDPQYYSEHDHEMLDYSTEEYDHDHQFNEESYFSSSFDFTSGEEYIEDPITNNDFIYSQQSQPIEDSEEEFNPQIGYNQEDIMPIPKKTPKILDLDSEIVNSGQVTPKEEPTPEYIPENVTETILDQQPEIIEEEEEEHTQYQQDILHQQDTPFDSNEEDIISEYTYLKETFDDEAYNQEQEEDFTEMTNNIYPETKEIKPSKGSPNLEDNRSMSFEKSSDRDYEKLQERSYESNKDNRKMDEKISLKEEKDYQKSDEKYFVQHDKDYRRHEDKYYPEMERDYRRFDEKDRHREQRNYEDLSKYDHERDYMRHDDRHYEKDMRKQDDRYALDREKYHSDHSREAMRYEERHYTEPDRDYNRFEIKESKPSKEYRRSEERYAQPINTYDKFNIRYYDPDKDYHKYDKFPSESEKEHMYRDEASYYDDRDPKHTNRPALQESISKTDLYNANVETLIRLVLSLPQGVTKQTGAQIIKQTMEAMGIAINEVLADAQESQSNIRRHIKDSYNTIDEYKMHVRQLEDEIYQYQKKAKDLDDIVSLFVYSDQPKPMR